MLKDGKEVELTREEALRLHREMWTDMQKRLGDDPTSRQRADFKYTWLNVHGYSGVMCSCFLCEYAGFEGYSKACNRCPIDWAMLAFNKSDMLLGTCGACYSSKPMTAIYTNAPISEILALPERKENECVD